MAANVKKLVPKKATQKTAKPLRHEAATAPMLPPLVVGLCDPGMTSLLRAGLGGLAASLAAIAEKDVGSHWPDRVRLGPGHATVAARRVTFDWGSGTPNEVLGALFDASFRLSPKGCIELPGAYPSRLAPEIAAALQGAIKKTFLQHGKSTTKAGGPVTFSFEIDERKSAFQLQPYSTYAHRNGAAEVCDALRSGEVKLSGAFYPGAAQRHASQLSYLPAAALCAHFALVGCISFEAPRLRAGILVVLEPGDLLLFSNSRRGLTPKRLVDVFVAGAGDAVLTVHLALKLEGLRDTGGISRVSAVLLKPMPWDKKQKYRAAIVAPPTVSEQTLDIFDAVVRTLPPTIRERSEEVEEDESSFFVATSWLRTFVTDNLAAGRRWFDGFATWKTPEKKPRFIHFYRRADNLGALFLDERKGLMVMVEDLEEAEKVIVRSVHQALRQRFGAIADETRESSPQTRKNRFNGERDKWRLAFAGAKTPDQIRGALADLWSRAGANAELRANWQLMLPLLRADRWQVARDLSLVALASYEGKGGAQEEAPDAASDE